MKTDVNGCSVCPPGTEQYESFRSPLSRFTRIQYDYRHPDGELFSTVAPSVAIARERRDAWLASRPKGAQR